MYNYNDKKYKKWRELIFKRDHFLCQLCAASKKLNAHHILRKVDRPDIAYLRSNGITLCEKCHHVVTGKEQVFEKIFLAITARKLTLELVYSFFSNLCNVYPELVDKFKKIRKWDKIPLVMSNIIKNKHVNTGLCGKSVP